MNLNADGQDVLDSNGIPMEVGKYYNINEETVKYLGQWIAAKNWMRFQNSSKKIFRKNYTLIDPPVRVEDLDSDEVFTDGEDDTYGGRQKSKSKSKSKKRKTKRRKTKKNKSRRKR